MKPYCMKNSEKDRKYPVWEKLDSGQNSSKNWTSEPPKNEEWEFMNFKTS